MKNLITILVLAITFFISSCANKNTCTSWHPHQSKNVNKMYKHRKHNDKQHNYEIKVMEKVKKQQEKNK